MSFSLPKLPYEFDALEPHIDTETMKIHYEKHHQGYIDKLNAAIAGVEDIESFEIEDLCKHLDAVPMDIETTVRNNGGGHANHSFFWSIMSPDGGGEPKGELLAAIEEDFSSFAEFRDLFTTTATSHFGSGWAWVVLEHKKLHVCSTPNQDNPWMKGNEPILGIDIWEHAYYLKNQNRRGDYVQAWWNVVNWGEVERRWKEALAKK